MRCTHYIFPRLSAGGIMIFDEFQGYGQESLLCEYFADKPVKMTQRLGLPERNYGMIVQKL
jgi:hypothetical protein